MTTATAAAAAATTTAAATVAAATAVIEATAATGCLAGQAGLTIQFAQAPVSLITQKYGCCACTSVCLIACVCVICQLPCLFNLRRSRFALLRRNIEVAD
jgi:hypothetical protein